EWAWRILSQIGRPIPDGSHDSTLYGFARDLRKHGATCEEARELMMRRIADCVPVWEQPTKGGSPEMTRDEYASWQLGRAWRECEPPDDSCADVFCDEPHTANWSVMPRDPSYAPVVVASSGS